MSFNIKRIAINPGGGDAPGLNAIIHAVVSATEPLGWEVFGERVAAQLQESTAKETRPVVFGHLLRAGSPISRDRSLGLNFGATAVRALAAGQTGVMVAPNPPRTEWVPLEQAVKGRKLVPLDGHAVIAARALDITLGD